MKKILLSIIAVLVFAININARTYTHTFKDGDLTQEGGVVKLTNLEWNVSKTTDINWSEDLGILIGAGNNLSLSTSDLQGCTITSVKVYSAVGSKGDAKLTIKVGNQTSNQFELSGEVTECVFNDFRETGDIEISWIATKRHYYVSKIEVTYELPEDMVEVEKPTFKTPINVYENKVTVTAETVDQTLALYYTLDGTDPSYEDFVNETGSTKSSKTYVMYWENLKETTTIKVMAVLTDGGSVYKSDIVEAEYIVSPTKPYIPVTKVANGKKFAFIANDFVATFLYGATNDYMQVAELSNIHNKYIETCEYYAFTFTSADGGYTIQDAQNRYMYLADTDDKISFAEEKPETGAIWDIAFNEDEAIIKNGESILYFSDNNEYFGCYTEDKKTEDMVLPSLYMIREYPQATITPEDGSEVKGLKEFTIYCEEGIAVSENFELKVQGNQRDDRTYEIDMIYNYTVVDENTLKFTIDKELKSENNITIELLVNKGNIYLNPEGMNYEPPFKSRWSKAIYSYTHLGDAPVATINSISPANGNKVETLGYILFSFSNIATTTDESKKIKVYREESNDTISTSFKFTNLKEDGVTLISQEEGGLLFETPITANGTYIIEIPDGYFVDRNSKQIKGTTLKYIVENETGIEDIIAEGETSWVVYNMTGVKVLDTDNAEMLNTLPKGIYIINGNKVLVR